MAMLHENQFPIALEADFLTMLDIDVGDEDNKSWPVKYYNRAWWNGRKPWDLDSSEILDALSIDKCLETHKKLLSSSKKGCIHWLPVLSSLPTMPTFNIGMALSPNRIKENDVECQQCSQFTHILSNSLNDLLDTHCFSNVMKTNSEAQWNMDMLWASTFHMLHEAAMIKEMAGPSLTSSVHRSGLVQFFDPKMGNRLPNSEISKNRDCNRFFSVSVIMSKNQLKPVF